MMMNAKTNEVYRDMTVITIIEKEAIIVERLQLFSYY